MYDVDAVRDRCLILATDGVWNVLNPDMAVDTVFDAERNNEKFMINPQVGECAVLAQTMLILVILSLRIVYSVFESFEDNAAPESSSCPQPAQRLIHAT